MEDFKRQREGGDTRMSAPTLVRTVQSDGYATTPRSASTVTATRASRARLIMATMQATHGIVGEGVSDDAHLVARTPDVDGRPYTVWRASERQLLRMDAWNRLVRSAPHGGTKPHARTWNWTSHLNGGRYVLRPSGHVSIPGEVPIAGTPARVPMRDGGESPYTVQETTIPVSGRDHSPRAIWRDPDSMAPCAVAHDPETASAVKIPFPDWAADVSADLGCYPSRRHIPVVTPARHPMADVYGARIAHGMPSNPYRGEIPNVRIPR